jgi:hypothetical protein
MTNAALMDAVIDYDRVYAAYEHALLNTLRGFSTGIAGLELWVPDEDPTVSLRHLLDAAAVAGWPGLAVRFGAATRQRLMLDEVAQLAARYGQAQVLPEAEAVAVIVNGLHPAPEDVAASAPRDGRRQACPAIAPTPVPALATLARAEGDDSRLHLDIDPETHVIRHAWFSTPGSDDVTTLLTMFCGSITGLPLLEAAHHGVARLERQLRGPAGPPPVPGIILPRNAAPGFELLGRLIAQALADHRAATGYAALRVPYRDPPGPIWRNASAAERRALVEAALARHAPAFALVAIEHDVRLVLAAPAELAAADRPAALFRLEAQLRAAVDHRLEVTAETRRDRNPLRRFSLAVEQP